MTSQPQTSPFDYAAFYDMVAGVLPSNCKIACIGLHDGQGALYLADMLSGLFKTFKLHMVGAVTQELVENILPHAASIESKSIVFIPEDGLTASCRFPDHHFDLVFIDDTVLYEQSKAMIRLWHEKVKHGGIIAGHDYIKEGVRDAVNQVLKYDDVQLMETANGLGVWWFKK